MDTRDILVRLLGRETISPAAKKSSKAVEELGGELSVTARAASKLDNEIIQAKKSIQDLAVASALAGKDDSLTRQLRAQQRELNRLTRTRGLIGDGGGSDAGKGIVSSIANSIRAGKKQFGEALSEGLSAAPPQAKAALMAALAPIVVSSASSIGAMAAGAIVAGIGTGAVAAGVRAAFEDPEVKAAGKGLLATLKTEVVVPLADEFRGPVLDSIGMVRGEARHIGLDLRAALAPAGKLIDPLVRGFTGLVKGAIPGFARGVRAAEPVMAVMEKHLPRIGRALSGAVDDISRNSDNAAAGFETMLRLVEGTVRVGGKVVGWLTDAYDIVLKTQLAVGVTAEKFAGWIPGVGGTLRDFNTATGELIDTANGAGEAFDRTGGNVAELYERQVLLNKSLRDGIIQAGGFKEALLLLNGGALSAREAEAAWQEAIDAVTESIDANGKSLKLTTEEGRANDATLRALAETGAARAATIYDQTLATKGQVAAEAAAAKAYEQGRNQLIRSAMQMGLSRKEAKAYADSIMAIPAQWTTKVNLAGHQTAIQRADAIAAAVKRITGKTIRIGVVGGRGGNLEGMSEGGPVVGRGRKGVDSVVRALAPGEHVITADEVDAAGGHGAIKQWRKSLTSGRRGGPAMAAAPAMATTGGGGNTYNITIPVMPMTSPAEVGRAVVESIRAYERGNGKGWRSP